MNLLREDRKLRCSLLGETSEIEESVFENPAKIIRRFDRVRRMNGLLDEPLHEDWRR
ncbi:MAG: hypothetical protein PVG53_12330 [Holophagae bacterium]